MKHRFGLMLCLLAALCLWAGAAAGESGGDPRKTAVEVNNESRRIEGDISVEGRDTYVTGLLVNADGGGAIGVNLDGSVSASGETDSLDHQDCTAVSVNAAGAGSEIAAEVNGNITAVNVWTAGEPMNLDNGGLSVWAGDGGKADVTVNGNIAADARLLPEGGGYTWSAGVGAYTDGTGAGAAVTVNGDVTASADHYSVGINANNEQSGQISVRVSGDVSGGSLGIRAINWRDDSGIDIIVDGTVKRSQDGISLEGDCPENIRLTFWKAEETAEGRIISVNEEMSEARAAEAEKAIQYIIRTEEGSGRYITTDAAEHAGFRVANEGDTVNLRVDAPEGFRVSSVSGGSGAGTVPERNADGTWSLKVPRGGGVELSVKLEQQPALFPAADTGETAKLKDALAERLPEEALALLPAGAGETPEIGTLKLVCPVPSAVRRDAAFDLKAARPYAEGETAAVLLALPAEGETAWSVLEGVGTADGLLRIRMAPDLLRRLAYRVFLAVIL